MAKRNLSKKPKRKQLSRKMKRKTLNRKKEGGRTRYRGDISRTGNSEAANESLQFICAFLVLFVVFILLPAAVNVAYTRNVNGPSGGATFQLPKNLESCINDKHKFNEFLEKVDITNNMLTIKDLNADEISILKEDDLLNQYIKADNTSISFDLNNIKLNRIKFDNFIKKIGGLDPRNEIVNIDCIDDTVSERFP